MHAALLHTPGNPDRAIEVEPLSPSADCPLVSCLMVSRGRLFPGTPMMLAVPEERVMRGIELGPRDAGTVISLDVPRLFAHILQVLPATTTIAVVSGNSPMLVTVPKVVAINPMLMIVIPRRNSAVERVAGAGDADSGTWAAV